MGAFLALSVATAQGGYASLSVGYAAGTSAEAIGVKTDYPTATTFTQSNVIGTYGGGIPMALAGGYMISEHFGLELGVNYFMGAEVTTDVTTTFYGDGSTTTSQGDQIRVLPQLVLSTGSDFPIEIFAKAGVVMPVGGSTNFKVDAISTMQVAPDVFAQVPVVAVGNATGNFSYGYTGTVGAAYGISDNLSIFGELQYTGLRALSKSQTITSYMVGGVEQISAMTVSDKETTSVDELIETSNTDSTKPTEVLGTTANYNSMGINLGVCFKF